MKVVDPPSSRNEEYINSQEDRIENKEEEH